MEFFFAILGLILLVILIGFFFVLALAFGLIGWILKGIKELFGGNSKV